MGCWDIEQHKNIISNPDHTHIIIEKENTPIGYVMILNLHNTDGSLEFSRFVMKEKGQGYGREALRAIQKWIFEHEHTHRLWLEVKDFNHEAYRLYVSEGFVQEGLLRESLRYENGYASMIVMSILRDEFLSRYLRGIANN
ncbi:GNAT family N-acetyltransferase [Shimazuella sp. AN120528]|nr:GNAT family N-acetyltransferase [Shimazuella soli]